MSKALIYEQHQKAFAQVEAFVIMQGEKQVGSIALKFPTGYSTRVWAYVHWFGTAMVRGFADGGGYDKATAAVERAQRKIMVPVDATTEERERFHEHLATGLQSFLTALAKDDGTRWARQLEDAGFRVLQAV